MGCGQTAPDPQQTEITGDGVKVPLGWPVATGIKNTALLYNEVGHDSNCLPLGQLANWTQITISSLLFTTHNRSNLNTCCVLSFTTIDFNKTVRS